MHEDGGRSCVVCVFVCVNLLDIIGAETTPRDGLNLKQCLNREQSMFQSCTRLLCQACYVASNTRKLHLIRIPTKTYLFI